MSFGKLYGFAGNARTSVLLAVARENDLDIEFIETNPANDLSEEYLQLNPLGRVPTFQAPDGWVLTEVIAIALYCEYCTSFSLSRLLQIQTCCAFFLTRLRPVTKWRRNNKEREEKVTRQNPQTTLLGRTERDHAEIVKWMSFINSEVQPHLADWFKPLTGLRPYNQANVDRAIENVNRAVGIVEMHLQTAWPSSTTSTGKERRYLVGETLTLADLFAASSLSRGFQFVFDKQWQMKNPNVTSWFKYVTDQEIWRRVVPEPIMVEEAVKHHPP